MKASKNVSLDVEVIMEMEKRGLTSKWVNEVLRKELGLEQK